VPSRGHSWIDNGTTIWAIDASKLEEFLQVIATELAFYQRFLSGLRERRVVCTRFVLSFHVPYLV
jgi:hypothetical protein